VVTTREWSYDLLPICGDVAGPVHSPDFSTKGRSVSQADVEPEPETEVPGEGEETAA